MAKSRNQKAKILVLEHLLEETGENRAVTMQEILEKLTECGVNAAVSYTHLTLPTN